MYWQEREEKVIRPKPYSCTSNILYSSFTWFLHFYDNAWLGFAINSYLVSFRKNMVWNNLLKMMLFWLLWWHLPAPSKVHALDSKIFPKCGILCPKLERNHSFFVIISQTIIIFTIIVCTSHLFSLAESTLCSCSLSATFSPCGKKERKKKTSPDPLALFNAEVILLSMLTYWMARAGLQQIVPGWLIAQLCWQWMFSV